MILIPEPDKVKEAEVRAAQAAPEEKPLPEVEQLRNELAENLKECTWYNGSAKENLLTGFLRN